MRGATANHTWASVLAVGAILALATPAAAGPPYLTDDPEPTDPGHWEIYSFAAATRTPDELEGEAGLDINYGAAKDLQLTVGLPLAFDNPNGFTTHGLRGGAGAIELAAKYRVVHQAEGGWRPDVSLFPSVFIPTDKRFGSARVNLLLPVWAEKDFGRWSVFGGGGYQINPGPDQRNFWQGGLAITRELGERWSLGAEVFAQTRDEVAGRGFATLRAGASYRLVEHWSLHASAGPGWAEGGGRQNTFYLALKADY